MLTVYKHAEGELFSDTTVADATKGSWINLVNPDPDELALVNIMRQYYDGNSDRRIKDGVRYGRTFARGN